MIDASAPYEFASVTPGFAGQLLSEAPTAAVAQAILTVAEAEAPIHLKDLTTRVAAIWGQKTGSSIATRIREISNLLTQHKRLEIRGEFIWKPNSEPLIRSRNNTQIPAERIAPEEIQEAILQVLNAGQGFTRQELINEVRAVFGFSRTGPALQQAIESAIEILISKAIVGEGSLGIAIRK